MKFRSNLGNVTDANRTATVSPLIPTPASETDADLTPISEVLASIEDDCIFPCFLGFTPDETTRNEVLNYLQKNGLDAIWQQFRQYYPTLETYLADGQGIIFNFLSADRRTRGGFSVKFGLDNRLRAMHINFVRPDAWLTSDLHWVDLPTVLAEVQFQPEVYILWASTRSDYTVVLLYKEERMQFTYNFNLSQDNPTTQYTDFLCLNIERTRSIDILLRVGEGALLNIARANSYHSTPAYYTPEDLLGIPTEDFVQFFIDHPNGCLDVSTYRDQ
jgi:hypothetical protein